MFDRHFISLGDAETQRDLFEYLEQLPVHREFRLTRSNYSEKFIMKIERIKLF